MNYLTKTQDKPSQQDAAKLHFSIGRCGTFPTTALGTKRLQVIVQLMSTRLADNHAQVVGSWNLP